MASTRHAVFFSSDALDLQLGRREPPDLRPAGSPSAAGCARTPGATTCSGPSASVRSWCRPGEKRCTSASSAHAAASLARSAPFPCAAATPPSFARAGRLPSRIAPPGCRSGSAPGSARTPPGPPRACRAARDTAHGRAGSAGTAGCRCVLRGALRRNPMAARAHRSGSRSRSG